MLIQVGDDKKNAKPQHGFKLNKGAVDFLIKRNDVTSGLYVIIAVSKLLAEKLKILVDKKKTPGSIF